MGQDPLSRRLVVARQIGLGDRRPVAHGGPQHLVRAREGHARHDHLAGLSGWSHRRRGLLRVAHVRGRLRRLGDLCGRLVFAQPFERRLPQRSGFGIAAVLDLGDQHRLDPMDVLGRLWRARPGEGRLLRRHALQRRNKGLRHRLAITSSDPAQIAKTALFPDPDQQRAEPRAALGRPAADHDFIAPAAFGLQPGR